MTEPDVTLTDYFLAIECAILAWFLHRARDTEGRLRGAFTTFFAAVGLAALTGGTVHGFFLDETSTGHAVLWPLTLIAIGAAALAAWSAGARLVCRRRVARWITSVAGLAFFAYVLLVVFRTQAFWIAIVHYLPATLFLTAAFLIRYVRSREPALLTGTAGLLLALLGSGLQQLRIGLHPVYLNHNALYHLVQAVALLLIFLAARRVIALPPAEQTP